MQGREEPPGAAGGRPNGVTMGTILVIDDSLSSREFLTKPSYAVTLVIVFTRIDLSIHRAISP